MNTHKIQLDIAGMTCDHCAVSVEKLLLQQNGVASATIEYQKERGSVIFDPAQVSEKMIIDSVNGTKNYRAKLSNPVTGSVREINNFALIIIGGGSAAFSAAIKAEELGKSTLMINAGLDFGGTCVNVGCVPSKILIRAAESVHRANASGFAAIKPRGADVDFSALIRDKMNLVARLQKGKYLDVVEDFTQLTMVTGWAKFLDANTIQVDDDRIYTAPKIIIATGAATKIPEIPGLADIDYLTHRSLFDLEQKPESLTIMGAGYIGLEIAMAYNRLGVKVRIIEFTDRVLRTQTADISAELQNAMRAEGIEILPNFRATKFEKRGGEVIIHCKCADGSMTQLHESGRVLVASGTRPNTAKLGLEAVSAETDASGHIRVNAQMQTNIPHIYAVGDVANTPPYVYTAAYEGRIAAENAFTENGNSVDYTALPWVVFTDPQVAGVGMDEVQAGQAGFPCEVSKLDLSNLPRAIVANDTRGFIKLIRHRETDRLLGARIVAPEGGELVQALAFAIKFGITVRQLSEELYPYLTLSEGVKLAAIGFRKDVKKLSCCAS